jgi:signal transduction histidine kinase
VSRLRPLGMLVALVALGVAGAMGIGAAVGMDASELAHLLALLVPAAAVTVVAASLASAALRRSSLRQRFLVVAAVGTVVALGNLYALAAAMFVSAHDATFLAVVLVYALASGVAAAMGTARASATALDRVGGAAARIAEGDLTARVGALDAGPELDDLAASVDLMAARIESARTQERRIEQTRRDLITAVSHDLRTPLANLRAMVEAVDDGVVADPPTIARYVGEMRRAVEQLSSLVDDLFELAQVDAGAIETETERARVADVVASALATVEAEATRKGVRLQARIGGVDDWQCSPRVIRVLQNLLGNAVRHTPADGTILVEGRAASGSLALTVEDSGEGIPEADIPHVFDPFYRADTARSGPGAGLGLALADRIVRALGGTIRVASDPSRGTRFDVTLPATGLSVSLAGATGSPRTRSGARPGSGSPRPS